MTRHRSTAHVRAIAERGRAAITPQFRFVVRMAYACHAAGVAYDIVWSREGSKMSATISASGEIPTPRALPKVPRPQAAWKPAIWDAAYRLDAYHDASRQRRCPGFVIEHSCGLSLVHPSESGELGVTEHGSDEDIRQGWLLTHTASGRGFGLTLTFRRAVDALLLAASFAVDWTQDVATLEANPEFRHAGNSVVATYGRGYERDSAKRRLLERAA